MTQFCKKRFFCKENQVWTMSNRGGGGGKVQGLNLPKLTFFSRTNILPKKKVIEQESLISIGEKECHLSIHVISPFSSHSRLSAISSSSSHYQPFRNIHKFPAMPSHSSKIQPVLAVPAMSSHYEPFTSIIIHSRHFKQLHEPIGYLEIQKF